MSLPGRAHRRSRAACLTAAGQSAGQARRPQPVGPLIGAIWLAGFLVSIDYTALNVALPTLAASFAVGTSAVSWVALVYMLVIVALTPVTGHVIARVGSRPALVGGLAVFAAASLASAAAPNLAVLVAMRALQGIGASVMFVIGPALIKTEVAKAAQDRAFAVYSTGPTAGLCAGPAIGGQLTAMFSWHAVFLFNLPVVVLTLILLRWAGRQTRDANGQGSLSEAPMPRLAVVACAVGSLSALLLALNQGEEWGWRSPCILALFCASGIGGVAVAALERGAATPLFDREVLRSKDFAAAAAAFLLVLGVFGGNTFLLPFYFEWLRKADPASVGHLLAIQPVATIIISNLAGWCFAATSRRRLCLIGIVLFAAGVAIFAAAGRDDPLLVPIAGLCLMGSGAGLYYPSLMQASMAGVPGRLAAPAASLQTAVRVLAQLLGVVVFETIFARLYPAALDLGHADAVGASRAPIQLAFHWMFWCGTAIAALALLPAFQLGRATEPEAER